LLGGFSCRTRLTAANYAALHKPQISASISTLHAAGAATVRLERSRQPANFVTYFRALDGLRDSGSGRRTVTRGDVNQVFEKSDREWTHRRDDGQAY
jgi:hypothetical protein